MAARLSQIVRENVFSGGAMQRKLISKFFSSFAIGRLVFRLSIMLKNTSLYFGSWSQRAVEYPWVLQQLALLKPKVLVLDVGCAESLLSHELLARGYQVVGLDLRDYYWKAHNMLAVKRNVMDTGFPENLFDAIFMVSTIEHVGLSVYGQRTLYDDGDIRAMRELHRILKPGGILVLTTPYIGGKPLRVNSFERAYNHEHLTSLIEGFQILTEDYFFPAHPKNSVKLIWLTHSKETIDSKDFVKPGLACLVLRKPQDNI